VVDLAMTSGLWHRRERTRRVRAIRNLRLESHMKFKTSFAPAMAAVLSACTASAPVRTAETTPAPAIVATPSIGTVLADGVTLIPGGFDPGRQPDGNTVIFRGPQGLVVLDTGRHVEHSQQILDYAAQSRQPIVAVVNSHWHLDHISGNPRLRAAYPALTVYASSGIEGAMSGFLANSRKQALQILAKPGDPAMQAEVRTDLATIDSGKALYPDVIIDASGERVLAGRALLIGYESNSVTAGDVWLFDPATRVLAAGDLVTLPAPFFDTACPAHWQAALAKLDRIDFTTLVPGHGAPMSRADFAGYRHAFDGLLACAASAASKDECLDGWQRDAAAFLPTESDKKLARVLLDYYLDGILRGDAKKNAALCGG
jgi:glyoxylase-like metal-dependent hydrolase (beta-lactamase superfamily II)